jgi:isoquinoline 1-oxidoreductase subunit beta
MAARIPQSRRAFLKSAVAVGGGLILGFHLPMGGEPAHAASDDTVFAPNAWVRIGADNRVTIMLAHSEMGQGVMTSLPTLVAEELDVDLKRVNVETAPAAPEYGNPLTGGIQLTGGSTSVRSSWKMLREAGAVARAMIVNAAAQRWNAGAETLVTDNGVVHDPAGKRSTTYGELAAAAAKLSVLQNVPLKKPGQYKLIGKPAARIDIPAKVNGTAQFGIDVRLPGMLTAVVARCPTFGGKLRSFNGDKAKSVKGVRHALAISSGVAVVADSFWPAKTGRDALEIQ